MTNPKAKLLLLFFLLSSYQVHADEKLIAGTISCSAEWNELCEDKKIISVPAHYRLCHHEIVIEKKSGEASYQVVASDEKSITVYFRAKGNQDRIKPSGASINLSVDLTGVEETETCEESISSATENPVAAAPVAAPSNIVEMSKEITTTESVDTAQIKIHACACSQWLNWMKVENCLAKEQRGDRPPCDSYEVNIQCVTSKDECRSIQKDNCPQVAGLNQSTSQKRLFVENSPYCRQ